MATSKKRTKKPKVNKANFRRVLILIQKSYRARAQRNKLFDFSRWFDVKDHGTVAEVAVHPCGTSGCLGGWGCMLTLIDNPKLHSMPTGGPRFEALMQERYAYRFYGISKAEGDYLFQGDWHKDSIFAPTRDVITKLERILVGHPVIDPNDKDFGGWNSLMEEEY